MKANELRIGNWYHFADNDGIVYRRVKEIKQNEFGLFGDYDGVNFGICQPILLTEEWLLKFGFEWRGLGGKYLTLFTPCGKALVYIDGYVRFTNTTIETPIRYVHQLQNLYFALTGEELTIKSI